MNNFKNYHKYLLKESISGYFYRRLILYPFLRLITGSEFLDVGCSVGIFLNYGSKKSLGLDVNPFNINLINKSKNKKALLIKENGEFPLRSESFKTVICDQVLEHIEDPTNIIQEISRAVKRNGKIIIGLPMEKGFAADSDHKKFYNIQSIKQKITTNFQFSYQFHFYFPIPFSFAGKYFSWQYIYIIFKSTK